MYNGESASAAAFQKGEKLRVTKNELIAQVRNLQMEVANKKERLEQLETMGADCDSIRAQLQARIGELYQELVDAKAVNAELQRRAAQRDDDTVDALFKEKDDARADLMAALHKERCAREVEEAARLAAVAEIRRMEETATTQAAQLISKERTIKIAEQALTILERVTWRNE